MRPGLARSVLGAILGFLAGCGIVVLLRLAFGIEPAWRLGTGLVLAAFTGSFGFIWGIGGFNPVMSQHPVEGAPDPTPEELEREAGVPGMLLNTVWRVGFGVLALFVIVLAVSAIPGVGLTNTSDPNGAVNSVGTFNFTLPGGNAELPVNELVLFFGFVLFTLLSLAIAGGIIAGLFYVLNRQVRIAKSLPPPDQQPHGRPNALQRSLGRAAATVAGALAPRSTSPAPNAPALPAGAPNTGSTPTEVQIIQE